MMEKEIFFGRGSHLNEAALAMYVDALKADRVYLLPGGILDHVQICKECKVEIVDVAWLSGLASASVVEPHRIGGKRLLFPVPGFTALYRIAAVVLVGIGSVAVLDHFLSSKRENSSVEIAQAIEQTNSSAVGKNFSDAKRRFEGQRDIADNFSPSPNLDNLVNASLRSESSFGMSPVNNAVVGKEILFQWKMLYNGSVRLTIISNEEIVVKSVILRKSSYFMTNTLSPGLYYWKLEHRGELHHVGKFLVR